VNLKTDKLGEFGIIDLFAKQIKPSQGWVVDGIGDDCAVVNIGGGKCLLMSVDMLLEGVHFLKEIISPYQLGAKTMAVNISDIAAMGGEPAAALLGLGMKTTINIDFITGFRDGLLDQAEKYNVDILGGDTVASRQDLLISLTIMGLVDEDQIVRRRGALPGDIIWLGGKTGNSAAGLHLLVNRVKGLAQEDCDYLVRAHLEPEPQVSLGRLLAERHQASAMIDVSDGVVQDLGHICERSKVGAELDGDRLPLSEAAIRLGQIVGRDPRDWALAGGEDYVLLFCSPAENSSKIEKICQEELGIEVRSIGVIKKDLGIKVKKDGEWTKVEKSGYDHFSRGLVRA
jgi:thiamine-monophosphate kinase